jgi:hypothetical protein
MTSTPEELEAWRLAFVASVEDGSLRAKVDAKVDPEWNAKYGDSSWDAALVVSGFCAPWDPILTHPEPRPPDG